MKPHSQTDSLLASPSTTTSTIPYRLCRVDDLRRVSAHLLDRTLEVLAPGGSRGLAGERPIAGDDVHLGVVE
jgi:hypothetical protein